MGAADEFLAFGYLVASIGILTGVLLAGQFWKWFMQ